MTNLERYEYDGRKVSALTAGARFIRGFRRLGIVVGTITLVAGTAIALAISAEQQSRAERKFEQAACIAGLVQARSPFKMKSYDQTKIDYEESGCPGYSFYGDSIDTVLLVARAGRPGPLEYAIQPFIIGAAVSAACAIGLFGACWTIGWLCAGFTRD